MYIDNIFVLCENSVIFFYKLKQTLEKNKMTRNMKWRK